MIKRTVVADEKVTIVASMREKDGFKQGYVVFSGKDKKQLSSAVMWAGKDHEIVELDNSGFKLEILNAAGDSYQNGKLSFWNCKISKGDKTYIVGINSQLLLDILVQNTFINGVCQSDLAFIRVSGQVGMYNEQMDLAKELMDVKTQKRALALINAKDFEIGRAYESLQNNQVYLGDLYSWVEVRKDVRKDQIKYAKEIVVLKKPRKMHIFVDTYHIRRIEAKSMKELFTTMAKILNRDSNDIWSSLHVLSSKGNILKNFPKRVAKEVVLENNEYANEFREYTKSFMHKVEKTIGYHNKRESERSAVAFSWYANDSLYMTEAIDYMVPMIAYRLEEQETSQKEVYKAFMELLPKNQESISVVLEGDKND